MIPILVLYVDFVALMGSFINVNQNELVSLSTFFVQVFEAVSFLDVFSSIIKSYTYEKRTKLFNLIGISAIFAFVILRFTNFYGDPVLYKDYETTAKDLISFFNPSKYPPSLLYLLMTLGATLVFLANAEKLKGKVVDFFSTFGRVPFFYYIIHIYSFPRLAILIGNYFLIDARRICNLDCI